MFRLRRRLSQVMRMGEHLGMNLNQHPELMWLAAEAYDAPLPDGWTEHFDWQGVRRGESGRAVDERSLGGGLAASGLLCGRTAP